MSPNASHRVRPGLSSAASLITTLLISFDQEVLNQHLNLVTPEYPFFESPCVSTNEISTSRGLGCEAAATRSLAVASDASAVSLASGLRHDADVGLGRRPALRIELLGLLVRHRAGDDHVLAPLPVNGRGDPVLG